MFIIPKDSEVLFDMIWSCPSVCPSVNEFVPNYQPKFGLETILIQNEENRFRFRCSLHIQLHPISDNFQFAYKLLNIIFFFL